MSRSRRHTPITGITTARSEAFDKKIWHRAFRAKNRSWSYVDSEGSPAPHVKESSDPWKMSKDGKASWHGMEARSFYAKLMRK